MKSDGEMDNKVFMSQMISLQVHTRKMQERKKAKEEKKQGIAKYLADDSSGSDDSLNSDENDDLTSGAYLGGKAIMKPEDNSP